MPDILKIKNEQGEWVTFPAFTGPPPDIGIGEVVAGATPSDAAASFSGTREAPLLNLTLPKGETGAAGVAVASAAPSLGELVWIDTGSSVNSRTLPEIDDDHISSEDTWSSNKINNLTLASRICDLIYPVGSIYLSINNTNPALIFGGTWESVGAGKVLQGVDTNQTAGTTVEAGLPNITGEAQTNSTASYVQSTNTNFSTGSGTGALRAYISQTNNKYSYGSGSYFGSNIGFDASASSSIYGNSDTVQPPAYLIYIWKRTA